MIQTGPEIHGNRPDLHLHSYLLLTVGKIYGNFNYHMVASVPILLGTADVILDSYHLDIILARQHLADLVNIINK